MAAVLQFIVGLILTTGLVLGGDGRARIDPDDMRFLLEQVGAAGQAFFYLVNGSSSIVCERDLATLIRDASQGERWAVKVLDAWGKPLPSGILTGNVYWLGNYDECVNPLFDEHKRAFVRQPMDTQYCAVHSQPGEPVEVRTTVVLGICVPGSCSRQSLVRWIEERTNITGLTTNHLRCSNDRVHEPNRNAKGTVAFIVIVCLLLVIVFIGTLIDLRVCGIFQRLSSRRAKDEEYFNMAQMLTTTAKSSWMKLLADMSALRTAQRVFSVEKRQGDNVFGCIDGIRVLSLWWVVVGHSVSSGIYYTSNIIDVQAARRNFFVHLLTSGAFAVDTFFVLSAFLTTVMFVRRVKRQGLSVHLMVSYYVHRYLRLTPTFVLVMFVSVYLSPYFGRGPLFPVQQGFEPTKCREGNWWTAFLYAGNFLRSDDLCLGVTWYLYNDMQFYCLAPLALIPFVKGKKAIGYAVTTLFALISVSSVVSLLVYYPNLLNSDLPPPGNVTTPVFFDVVYMAPWCRIGAYAIGMATAFVIVSIRPDYRLARRVRLVGHIVAVVAAFMTVYWKYFDYLLPPGFGTGVLIGYEALSRLLWSTAVAWLICVCSFKQGGAVNKFLSSARWSPLVRLNFAAYLTHIIVIFITVFNQSQPLYFELLACAISFMSHLLLSYAAALMVVIFFETPFVIVEKKLFKR